MLIVVEVTILVYLEKYDIDYLLVENETAIAKNIAKNENYEKVYEDDYFSVIVKKELLKK